VVSAAAPELSGGQGGLVARLIELCARQRGLTILLVLGAALLGVRALRETPLDALPDLSDVQVIVFAEWPGRGPELVEDQLTYPISARLLSAPGVRYVRGESYFGFASVSAIFEDGTDLYWARSRVLEYLGGVRAQLPEGV
jgi:copper/silver efflux system protein